jgi:WD40 repeat protein
VIALRPSDHGAAWVLLLAVGCHSQPPPTPVAPEAGASQAPSVADRVEANEASAPAAGATPDALAVADAQALPPLPLLELDEGRKHPTISLTFLSPGDSRALSSEPGGVAIVWDLRTGSVLRRFEGPAYTFASALPTKDGKRVLTDAPGPRKPAGQRAEAHLWELETGRIVATFDGTGDEDGAHALALSPDERSAATVTDDGAIELWDVASARMTRRIEGGGFLDVAYGDDGQHAFWVDESNQLCALDLAATSPPQCHELDPERHGYADASHGAVGPRQTLTANRYGTLALWANDTGRRIRSWQTSAKAINGLALVRALGIAAVTTMDRTVRLWRIGDAKLLADLHVAGVPATVALSSDGRRVLFATEDDEIHLWTPGAAAADAGAGQRK